MAFIKKNLLFCILVAICLLAFAIGAFLAFQASGKVASAERQLSSARAELKSLENASPAPTAANVAASEENVDRLLAKLSQIRENLQRGSRLRTSTDGVAVMTAIQQYISDFQEEAESQIGPNGEPDPIETDEDFAFGFERYIDEATPLDDPVLNRRLDQQRQILSYLVNQLINSDPDSIESVQRELIEGTVGEGEEQKGFKVGPAISARVPGAIDTMAFSVTFTGYTTALRRFLNNLAKPELPIVVRRIEVERPSGSETIAAPTPDDALDSIFGGLGGNSTTDEPDPDRQAQEPVISENVSRFTVIVEFIEVVLPNDADDKPATEPV
jgi:hypothetical protein